MNDECLRGGLQESWLMVMVLHVTCVDKLHMDIGPFIMYFIS